MRAWVRAFAAAAAPTAFYLLMVAPAYAGTHQVSMVGFTFAPASITITKGESVEWTYDQPGSVTSPDCESPQFRQGAGLCPGHSTTGVTGPTGAGLWDSGVHRATGFPFTHTFTQVGTYHYICTVHGGQFATGSKNQPITNMEGDVIVLASGEATTSAGEVTSSKVRGKSLARTGTRYGSALALAGLVGALGVAAGLSPRHRSPRVFD
ncbi:MAG: hypothetical protein ABR507_11895 [Actinomycetota bacterium]|nr:hypothetical protein [Actinomycetota bacterium]